MLTLIKYVIDVLCLIVVTPVTLFSNTNKIIQRYHNYHTFKRIRLSKTVTHVTNLIWFGSSQY